MMMMLVVVMRTMRTKIDSKVEFPEVLDYLSLSLSDCVDLIDVVVDSIRIVVVVVVAAAAVVSIDVAAITVVVENYEVVAVVDVAVQNQGHLTMMKMVD
jgi:selenocysteine lyase/cysteine desulfurase